MSEMNKEDVVTWLIVAAVLGVFFAAMTSKPKVQSLAHSQQIGGPISHEHGPNPIGREVPKPKPSDSFKAWLDDNFIEAPCNCGGGY